MYNPSIHGGITPRGPATVGDDSATIVGLEAQVIALAKRLSDCKASEAKCHADYLGTLHVNLCQLIRVASKVRAQLETDHGFIR